MIFWNYFVCLVKSTDYNMPSIPDNNFENITIRPYSFAVLMSTFNGVEYLNEQVESILTQKGVDITLYIRDDGSTDFKTIPYLQTVAKKWNNVKLIEGKNIGVVKSFFELLLRSDCEYDFFAFADQDDVWLPDKLLHSGNALTKLCNNNEVSQTEGNPIGSIPAMYYSRLEFVDKTLNHLGYSIIPTVHGFHNALVQNQATGCTVVLNRAAKDLLSRNLPAWSLMHDWWCYLVISAFGLIHYDETPGIKYRKHGSNVTPATPNFILELYARTRRFLGENDIPEKVTDQAREFLRIHGNELPADKREILDGFLHARSLGLLGRLKYILKMPVARNTPIDNLIMRILIVFGRF
jgi:glycosyltransferase involved in cell wall biosynthesis